jgi:hypothetical protein
MRGVAPGRCTKPSLAGVFGSVGPGAPGQAAPKDGPNPMIYLRERAFERDDAFLVERLVASFRSATSPVGSFGSPACCRNFAAISEISSGA